MRIWLVIFLLNTTAQAAVLYDASANTRPDQQGWVFLTNPLLGATATQQVEAGVLTLDTSFQASDLAGYFGSIPALNFRNPNIPTIDLSLQSFVVEFTMRQTRGSNIPDSDPQAIGERNRGGFAVIAISEQLTGIELQFQSDRVLSLDETNSAFPIGEVNDLDTSVWHDYRLNLHANTYELIVDGNALLEGPLRNYTDIAPQPPLDFPYTTPSFLFFGDDTGRGQARTQLTTFSIQLWGDCTEDGLVTKDDLACLANIAERDEVLRTIDSVVGDLDGNRRVDFDDFLTLARHFEQAPASYVEGNLDLSEDGVTFDDFLLLARNFGMTKGAIAVPEPRGGIVLMMGIIVSFCRRMRAKWLGGLHRGGRRRPPCHKRNVVANTVLSRYAGSRI